MLKKVINIILIILAVLFQISFLTNHAGFLKEFNLILVLMIFISLLDYNNGICFMMIASLVYELYSPYPQGAVIFSYFFTFLAITWLFKNFFTNKSLYALIIIGFIGTLCYNIIFYILNTALFLVNMNKLFIELSGRYFINLLFQIAANLAGLAGLFIIYRTVNKKMRAVFIIK